jgi:hypothetical protein
VLEGELSVVCGDDRFSAPAGSFVFMPRGRARRFWSTNGSARVLLIAVPGGIENYFQELHAAQETERGAVQAKYGVHPLRGYADTDIRCTENSFLDSCFPDSRGNLASHSKGEAQDV